MICVFEVRPNESVDKTNLGRAKLTHMGGLP